MKERDPLDALLGEWKSPEPSPGFDRRVMDAYREAFPAVERQVPRWRRLWSARISVPVPVLVAAMAVLALFLWYRSASRASAPPTEASGIVTRLSATGFQPLPNGEARVVPVNERHHEIR